MATWPRAAQFAFFRGYQRPHYAVTARPDVTHLLARRQGLGLSPYRACIWAIGAGLHGVPELLTRFRGDQVTAHDRVELSMTVPVADGTFRYGLCALAAGPGRVLTRSARPGSTPPGRGH